MPAKPYKQQSSRWRGPGTIKMLWADDVNDADQDLLLLLL